MCRRLRLCSFLDFFENDEFNLVDLQCCIHQVCSKITQLYNIYACLCESLSRSPTLQPHSWGLSQAPLSMNFSQEYWNGLLFPSSRRSPSPRIKLMGLTPREMPPSEPPGQPIHIHISILFLKILFPYSCHRILS